MNFKTAKVKDKADVKTKVKDKDGKKAVEKASNSHESVELSEELTNAINWLGTKFSTLRPWIGKDGGDYASITPKAKVKCPDPYETVGDVAEAVIDNLKEVSEETGIAIFASYSLSYRGNKAVGRLISVSSDGRLVLALEVEYAISGAKGGIQTMVPKAKEEKSTDAEVEVDDEAGFGSLS